MLFSVFMVLSSISHADTAERGTWFVVESKRQISLLGEGDNPCRGVSEKKAAATCQKLQTAATEALSNDRTSAQADRKGVVFSSGAYRLIVGPTTAGYGDILINGEPIDIE